MKWIIIDVAGNIQIEDSSKKRILDTAKNELDEGSIYELFRFKSYVENGKEK